MISRKLLVKMSVAAVLSAVLAGKPSAALAGVVVDTFSGTITSGSEWSIPIGSKISGSFDYNTDNLTKSAVCQTGAPSCFKGYGAVSIYVSNIAKFGSVPINATSYSYYNDSYYVDFITQNTEEDIMPGNSGPTYLSSESYDPNMLELASLNFATATGMARYASNRGAINSITVQFSLDRPPGPNPSLSVPEPATAALVGVGLIGVAWTRRKDFAMRR